MPTVPRPKWCVYEGDDGYIDRVSVGGENAWYMMGHVFWSEALQPEVRRDPRAGI
ncbi:MAG: hypothetical protein ACLUNO_07930 [Oscillospiraceae bacterium]